MKTTPTPSQIIHRINEAAESVDGAPGYILAGPDKGFYRSKFTRSEVRDVLDMAKRFEAANAQENYSRAEVETLLHRLIDVIHDVRPTQDAGMGLMRSTRRRLLDVTESIHEQSQERQRASARALRAPQAVGLGAGLRLPA